MVSKHGRAGLSLWGEAEADLLWSQRLTPQSSSGCLPTAWGMGPTHAQSHAFVESSKSDILAVADWERRLCPLQLPSAISSLLGYKGVCVVPLEIQLRRSCRWVVLTMTITKVKICHPEEDTNTELVNRWCQFRESSRLTIKESQLESSQLLILFLQRCEIQSDNHCLPDVFIFEVETCCVHKVFRDHTMILLLQLPEYLGLTGSQPCPAGLKTLLWKTFSFPIMSGDAETFPRANNKKKFWLTARKKMKLSHFLIEKWHHKIDIQ